MCTVEYYDYINATEDGIIRAEILSGNPFLGGCASNIHSSIPSDSGCHPSFSVRVATVSLVIVTLDLLVFITPWLVFITPLVSIYNTFS